MLKLDELVCLSCTCRDLGGYKIAIWTSILEGVEWWGCWRADVSRQGSSPCSTNVEKENFSFGVKPPGFSGSNAKSGPVLMMNHGCLLHHRLRRGVKIDARA